MAVATEKKMSSPSAAKTLREKGPENPAQELRRATFAKNAQCKPFKKTVQGTRLAIKAQGEQA